MRVGFIFLASLFFTSCLDQYRPFKHWEKYSKERELAHRKSPVLAEDGSLPTGGDKVPVEVHYQNLCASCHGGDGKANTALAKTTNPPPRNFVDAAWQSSTDDERMFGVIKKGGGAYGLNPVMAPWGAVLDDDEIKEMVKFIRKFK